MTITETLARYVVDTSYDDLPPKTTRYAKELALVVLGSALWGSTLRAGKIVAKIIKDMKAAPEAGVLGSGFKTTLPEAALAGGTFTHAAEWEGDSRPEMVGVMPIFPAVFPLAEKLGSSGKEVIAAAIIAHEVSSRIGLACLPATDRGFFAVPVFGNFGAAIASAKLMKLSLEQVLVAIGLAASQAAGTLRQHDSMAHYVETGFPCRNGMVAALLARAGFTADMNILEDTNHGVGFCTAVAGKEGFRIEKVTEGLGKENRFELLDTKHFPCHSYQQRAIEAAMDVMARNNIEYGDIESVTVEMKPSFVRQLDMPDPTNMEYARVSVQHGIAGAILGKKVGVDTFTDMAAAASDFKEARAKVKLVARPEWEKHGLKDFEIVTIKLKNGKQFTSPKWESWRGHHTTPFTREETIAKFRDATGDILSPKQIERAIELVLDLDKQKTVNELMKILTFPG